MKQSQLKKIARDIIKSNIYFTLSTTDRKFPWAAPLYYCLDDKYTFYYISQMDSLHTKHILKNPKKEGTGNGVQGKGKAYLLKDKEIPEALKWYHTSFVEIKPESFKAPNPYCLFRIIPEKFYVLDPDASVDKRVEVKLLENET